jgi:uncharacterized protein
MIKIDQSETINLNLFDYLVKSHALSEHGYHGPDHWLRVLQNGRLLTPLTGANLRVVELFALIHDSKRINENIDPEHGPRAALFAASLRNKWFAVTDDEMQLLDEACRLHSDGFVDSDVTVQTCWDSDRLDLGRVGIKPHPTRLCTDAAKNNEFLAAAYERSIIGS